LDLSRYSIGVMHNGADALTTPSESLTGSLAPASRHVIGMGMTDTGPSSVFHGVYGAHPNDLISAQMNGDDAILLYLGIATGDGSDAIVVDTYGQVGQDGSGTAWDYTDSYASRCIETPAGLVFDAAVWDLPGAGALTDGCGGIDICESALLLNLTSPWSPAYCIQESAGTPYCSGADERCPCSNGGDGSLGDAGCANSAAHSGSTLRATGSTSIADDDLTLRAAAAVPGEPAVFFQGDHAVAGGLGLPFGDGLKCVLGRLVRLEVTYLDDAGRAHTSVQIASAGGATPGDVLRYQLWYADHGSSQGCGFGFNLSNGLEIVWSP